MKMRSVLAGVLVLFSAFASATPAATDVRDEPGGKRLLFVDGDDIRAEPGGPRKLFIDGDAIRPEPGGKRLLFVDGQSIRAEPGGPRILFLDGNDVRNAPGGVRLLYLDGNDIRPEPGGERLFFIDGAALTRQQLAAVLYLLKPELFAAQKKDEEKKEVAHGDLSGEWKIDAAINLDGDNAGGSLVLKKVEGGLYIGTVKLKGQPDAPIVAMGDTRVLWLAIGSPNVPGIGMYQPKDDGSIEGQWIVADENGVITGTEHFTGPKGIEGTFNLVEGKSGDVTYNKGTLTLKEIFDDSGFGKPLVRLDWDIDGKKYVGVGFRESDAGPLVISFGEPDQKLAIVNLQPDGDTMSGAIVTEKGKQGIFNLMK